MRAEQRRRTEARILDAAAQGFLATGYERTTIRAVAAAAGVDAGLVMHYFGSKQELFRRVIDAAPFPGVSGPPEQAAEQILTTLAGRLASEPTASLAVLRSMLTSPEASSVVSAAMARYQAQISQHPQGQIFEPGFRLIFPTMQLFQKNQQQIAYGGVPSQYWLNPATGVVELTQ